MEFVHFPEAVVIRHNPTRLMNYTAAAKRKHLSAIGKRNLILPFRADTSRITALDRYECRVVENTHPYSAVRIAAQITLPHHMSGNRQIAIAVGSHKKLSFDFLCHKFC